MSYSYVNGCYVVTTDIRPGFKRFHKCNAQYRQFSVEYLNVWQFISYNTPIVQVVHDTLNDYWRIYLNDNPYSYSRTTSKQFNRYIIEHATTFPFGVSDVMDAINFPIPVTPDIGAFYEDNFNITVYYSNYGFSRVWR